MVALAVAIAVAIALVTLAVFAAEVRAGSFDSEPPEAVLMKYKTVLQARGNTSGTWHFYEGGGWNYIIYDNFGEYEFPDPATVGAGRRLHVRFDEPQRPSAVTINAWPRVKDGYDFEIPAGQRRQLKHTLSPVVQGGETVGWDVFFRVNQPERHYYLVVRSGWERVPGTHISYGKNVSYGLHARTR